MPLSRTSARPSENGVVVFLIGMRIVKPWHVRTWLQVVRSMPRMIAELEADPASGFLGARMAMDGPGAMLVQYWVDTEHLRAYSHDRDHAHRPAWAAFNRLSRASGGAVGVWHETYAVAAGATESVYVNVPAAGLATALERQERMAA